ncbi:MAG: hypothetical protein HYY04_13970 [Chloroflexi bacterium]|nr:hypothetical protein [Chloroflexota bacterium]
MDVPLFENNTIIQDHLRKWPWTEASGYAPQQRHFLTRLERLQLLARIYQPTAQSDEWRRRLLHKAIYSTYLDCVALGLLKEAQAVLRDQSPKPDTIAAS